MTKGTFHTEVLIAGGGPAGLTLAACLGHAGIDVICVDLADPAAQTAEAFDGRTTAIALGSKRIFDGIGLWDSIAPDACRIAEIRTADKESPFFLHFDAGDVGEDAFGWIVENRTLRRRLFDRLQQLDSVRHLAPARITALARRDGRIVATLEDGREITADLLCGADGRRSMVREWAGIGSTGWRYWQHAMVCVVTHEEPHHNIAIEHFRPGGPFAILPMLDDEQGRYRSSLVWTENSRSAPDYHKLPQDEFDAELNKRFGDRLGRVSQIGRRWIYPLGLMHADRYTAERVALIGDAAHVIHPIAGQGLNMGFRDVAALSELVVDQRRLGGDPGAAALLRRFERQRMRDNLVLSAVTDGLNRLFSNDLAVVHGIRSLGLGAVERIPPLKRFFMGRAMGIGREMPRLVRGEAL